MNGSHRWINIWNEDDLLPRVVVDRVVCVYVVVSYSDINAETRHAIQAGLIIG